MPLLPIKYENGLIYKVCCNDPTISDCYIGSTTNIVKRKQNHKHNCNNEKVKIIIIMFTNSFETMVVGIIGRWF